MLYRMLDFISALRAKAVEISTSEAVDAFIAALSVGFCEEPHFRFALRASLIKDSDKFSIFEELYPKFFLSSSDVVFEKCISDEIKQRLKSEIDRMEKSNIPFKNPLFPMVFFGDGIEMELMVQQASMSSGASKMNNMLQIGKHLNKLLNELNVITLDSDIDLLIEELSKAGWNESDSKAVRDAFEDGKMRLRDISRAFLEKENERNSLFRSDLESKDSLMKKPIVAVDSEEAARMREITKELAIKLRNKLSMRNKKGRRGRLDMKSTIRRNLELEGVPFHIVRLKRRIEKQELFILCDISSSVSNISRFMLQFVYTIQDCLSKVRSFVFISDIGEVTDFFKEENVEKAVGMALSEAEIRYGSRSDYGKVFRDFAENHIHDIGYRTNLMIIGDARNNMNDPCALEFEAISERCRELIWINPETMPFWDTGDSVMSAYLPFCREARVVRNLRDLELAISSLFITG